jgi:hypothetical protein
MKPASDSVESLAKLFIFNVPDRAHDSSSTPVKIASFPESETAQPP